MNNLEERIYRDARRIAAQVTDADIPPLRLAPAPRWSGTGRGSAGRRILIPLAAAASVAAVVAGLLVAGHRSPVPHHHHVPPTAPGKHVASDPRLAAQALDWYFPASGRTYTHGLAFTWAQRKVLARDVGPCLAKAGFPQPPFTTPVQDYQLAFPDNSEFPNLAQLAVHPDQAYLKGWPTLTHPTAARQRAFGAALRRCTARFAQPTTRVDRAATPLQSAWLNIITAIEHSAAVTATQPPFARCLEAHGVPARFATQTDNGASNPLFTGYFAWADSTNQAVTSPAQYQAELRHETRVFIACAPPVLSVLERLQLDRRARFFHQHAAQIARIARLAEDMPTGR